MFIEKKRIGISPRALTANGDKNGIVTVTDTTGFFVKQIVYLVSNSQQPREFEIKRFISKTKFKVGPVGQTIQTYSDITDFTVIDSATISAPEQNRPGITDKDHERAVYQEEPVVAKRVISVDQYGDFYTEDNPLPVTSTSGEVVNLKPQISNLSLLLANTDYILNIPSNVRRFSLKIREGKGELRIYNISGGNYLTVSRDSSYSSDDFRNALGFNLIVQSSQPNCVLESISWILDV